MHYYYDIVYLHNTLEVHKGIREEVLSLATQEQIKISIEREQKSKPKTADEMFAELGWTKNDDASNKNCLWYENITSYKSELIFFIKDSEYLFSRGKVDIPLHKAIHKKLEELGWL